MKEPKTLKDVWYCYSGNCDSMCVKQVTPAIRKMVKRWIKHIEAAEKEFVKKFKAKEEQWNKEYEQGEHRSYSHNIACEWLGSVPNRFAEERAQVKILKKIFNIGEK